jgi:formiminoglutamase
MAKGKLDSVISGYKELYAEKNVRSAAKLISAPDEKNFSATLKKNLKSKLPTVVLCGEQLPSLKGIIGGKPFTAALISSGDFLANPEDSFPLLTNKNLKSFALLGVQRYLFNPGIDIFLNDSGFETLHLGEIRDDITQCEPLLRDAQYIFIDMHSVKYADYPWSEEKGNPNGFMSNEICQIVRYAAFSQKLKVIFLFGISLEKSRKHICDALASQVVWHIFDGITSNLKEDPMISISKGKLAMQFMRKIVDMGGGSDAISFVTSLNTGRWWMEIPVESTKSQLLVPCTQSDYNSACAGNIPIRWLFYYRKCNTL